jgi:ComF family protein
MRKLLLDLLFPPSSLTGTDGVWVTEAERAAMAAAPIMLGRSLCADRDMPSVQRLAAAAEYDASLLLKTAIHRFKYRRVRATEDVLGAMLGSAAQLLTPLHGAVLCPVPLHWTRRFSRGFNQSELLAHHVARLYGCVVTDLLRRVRATGHQAHRKRAERLEAMGGAFAVRKGLFVPDRVILVDDVCTTGATLEACAEVLREAGVHRVEGLVLALG